MRRRLNGRRIASVTEGTVVSIPADIAMGMLWVTNPGCDKRSV